VARRIGGADQAKEPLVLHRSTGERVPYPGIESTARHVEEAAHHGRIKPSAMGF